jgi:GNAT superfamily N-acetyltransferase
VSGHPRVRIVPATGVALADLQALVEACFAGRPRPTGWFARKLVREAVDRDRSLLAFGPGDELVGYTLTGAEPDETVGHSAGLGVLPAWRGEGIGAALMFALGPMLRRTGLRILRVNAEPPRRRFYQRVGFVPLVERHTLWAMGTGAADLDLRAHPRGAWSLPGLAVAGWRAGTWMRTPETDAGTLQLADGDVWAHVSREGRALLIQRLSVIDERRIHSALDELRSRCAGDTAVLLHGCEAVSCVTVSLLRAKWRVAQTACEMQRDLDDPAFDAVDKQASPAA